MIIIILSLITYMDAKVVLSINFINTNMVCKYVNADKKIHKLLFGLKKVFVLIITYNKYNK